MYSNDFITCLDINFNENQLITEFKSVKLRIYNPHDDYTDGVSTTTWLNEFPKISDRKISTFLNDAEINSLPETLRLKQQLSTILCADLKVIFTLQRKNKGLPLHKDPPSIPAAINIVLGISKKQTQHIHTTSLY